MTFFNLLPVPTSITLAEGCGGACKGGCKACEGCEGCKTTAKVTLPDEPIV